MIWNHHVELLMAALTSKALFVWPGRMPASCRSPIPYASTPAEMTMRIEPVMVKNFLKLSLIARL